MAEVTGFTSQRMLQIENTTVVDGEVQGDNLVLLTREGTPIDAGSVRGPQGIQGVPGPVQAINDQTGATYAPRIFATKAELDSTWTTAPVGAMAVTVDTLSVWEKSAAGWRVNSGWRVFANATELNANWLNAPTGSHAVTLDNNAEWYKNSVAWGVSNGVRVFNSTAERDARWAAPPYGGMCITVDTWTVWTWSGSWVGGVPTRRDSFFVSIAPPLGNNWPSPGDGSTEWMGNTFSGPSWAYRMRVRIDLGAIRPQDNTSLYNLRTKITQGGYPYQYGSWTTFQAYAVNYPHSFSWSDYFTLVANNPFRISVCSEGAANGLNANPSTVLRYDVQFSV